MSTPPRTSPRLPTTRATTERRTKPVFSDHAPATPEAIQDHAPTTVKFEGQDVTASDESETGLERRRGPGRRRSDYSRSAEEGEMTPEQFLLIKAIDAFKLANDKMYPSWTDVLEVVRLLGYRKTQTSELSLRGADDWTEAPDAPSGVRSKPGHPETKRDTNRHAA